MDLDRISQQSWNYFQYHYPDAHAYLLRASLIGEYAALTTKADLNNWELARFEELKQLLDISGVTA